MFHSSSFYWSVELLVHFLDGKTRIPTGFHSLSGCLKNKIFAVNPSRHSACCVLPLVSFVPGLQDSHQAMAWMWKRLSPLSFEQMGGLLLALGHLGCYLPAPQCFFWFSVYFSSCVSKGWKQRRKKLKYSWCCNPWNIWAMQGLSFLELQQSSSVLSQVRNKKYIRNKL